MKRYQHIFFDLDHTLWDFERNSEETIQELYHEFQLEKRIDSALSVYQSFSLINRHLWSEYHLDRISKEQLRKRRFEMVLEQNGLHDPSLAEQLSDLYIERCPAKPHLLPNSLEVLDYLSARYPLHLISNGFEEITQLKLAASSLHKYFLTVCTPSQCGYKKPQPEIFQFALKNAGAACEDALMVGDDLEADILGAKRCGIHQVYFNPALKKHDHHVTFEIGDIIEIKNIL